MSGYYLGQPTHGNAPPSGVSQGEFQPQHQHHQQHAVMHPSAHGQFSGGVKLEQLGGLHQNDVQLQNQMLYMQAHQLQHWMPDPQFLQALRAQGAGQYRVTLRPEGEAPAQQPMQAPAQQPITPQHMQHMQQMQHMYQMQQQQQQHLLQHLQQQQQHMQQQQQQEQQQQQQHPHPHHVLMEQLGLQHAISQPQMMQGQPMMMMQGPGGQMGMLAPGSVMMGGGNMGLVPVDVVNNGMGMPVRMYHAGAMPFLVGAPGVGGGVAAKKERKRRPRDPLAPKPARYAWNFFFKDHYNQARSKEVGLDRYDVQKAFTDIGATLGMQWKKLTPSEREPFLKLAAADKKRYAREMLHYLKTGSARPLDSDDADAAGAAEDDLRDDLADEAAAGAGAALSGAGIKRAAAAEDEVEDEVSETAAALSQRVTVQDAAPDAANKRMRVLEPPLELTADILVTDDDDMFIFMIQKTLTKIALENGVKLNIDVASNGEDALRKVVDEKRNYAVVTMDKEMGQDIDGIETIKRMRDSGYNGLVVGISGSDQQGAFEEVGADASLQKGPALIKQVYRLIVEKKEAAVAQAAQQQ
jgi:hypothetical protein